MKRKVILILMFSTFSLLAGCNKKIDENSIHNEATNIVTTTEVTSVDHQDSAVTAEISTENISPYIPKGWHLLVKNNEQEPIIAEGDLNKDGLTDKAFAIEEDSNNGDSESLLAKRQLVLITGKNDGTYNLELISKNAFLSEIDGGPFGDPVDRIEISRGSLFLRFMGGSNLRWYSSYQFRYQDNDWFLIGATEGAFIEIDGKMDNIEEDYNLITGDYIFKKLVNGKIITTKGNREIRDLVKLVDFSIQYETKSVF